MSKVACIQMVSSEDVGENLSRADALIDAACAAGADIVVLPENFGFLSVDERSKLAIAEQEGSGAQQEFLAEQSQARGIWLLGGSVPIRVPGDDKRVYAACRVHGPDGELLASYNKMHLFDVQVPGSSEAYRESACIAPGDTPVVVDCAGIRIGLTICYDLRFPELYRRLTEMGAQMFVVPSAFTERTGKVHWEPLLKARAIENLSWVAAANQGGKHACGRRSHGHSMILDPWGTRLSIHGAGIGLAIAEIDLEAQQEMRKNFPCLEHRIL